MDFSKGTNLVNAVVNSFVNSKDVGLKTFEHCVIILWRQDPIDIRYLRTSIVCFAKLL